MFDFQLCQEDDVRLFTFLLPDMYTQFTAHTIGNAELLLLIVSSIDGIQVLKFIKLFTALNTRCYSQVSNLSM